jgi:membrane-bound lytic murein transglycosylase D
MKIGLIGSHAATRVGGAGGADEVMRGKLFQILIPFMILPLFGCAPSTDVSDHSPNQISVTRAGEDTLTRPANMANTATMPELSGLDQMGAERLAAPPMPASGALPFVRNQPKSVAPFPLVLNRAVQSYINGYLAQPQELKESFQRSSPFMPEMLGLLQDDGLPPELIYLSFAESAFSDDGAGPWQLNKTTARRYGLTINQWLDERRDPIKSTRAAAEYLAELHDQTGADWRMTLVAWNNGDAGVNRYLQLMTAPYERLMKRLPHRTCALMNRFMAVALIARHAQEYGLRAMRGLTGTPPYHVIAVDGGTQLRAVTESNHTTIGVLRRLNPALLTNQTPPGPQSYPIRVPGSPGDSKSITTSS